MKICIKTIKQGSNKRNQIVTMKQKKNKKAQQVFDSFTMVEKVIQRLMNLSDIRHISQ